MTDNNASLNFQRIDHIGIAVSSIEAQRDYYERILGMRFEGLEALPEHGLRAAFFTPRHGTHGVRIELLEPIVDDSVIARYLERRGPGLHHIAYAVRDLDKELAALKEKGIRLIDEIPRPGTHGRRIAFLHPASTFGVLTEFCEDQCESPPAR